MYIQKHNNIHSNMDVNIQYPNYMTVTQNHHKYGIHYTDVDSSPSANPKEMLREFKAQVARLSPYDNAMYWWAQIQDGTILFLKGTRPDRNKTLFYLDADDMDIENTEWCDAIIDIAIANLEKYNISIEPIVVNNACDSYQSIAQRVEGRLSPYQNRYLIKEIQDTVTRVVSKWLRTNGWELSDISNYLVVDVDTSGSDMIKVEIRCELDFDEMSKLIDVLDPVIRVKFDKNAYFEPVDPGIIEAYIRTAVIEGTESTICSNTEIDRYDKDVISYTKVAAKSVEDFDGFLTDYTGYKITLADGSTEYECYLGDNDIYGPWNGYGLDFECTTDKEFKEWWRDYPEDVYSSAVTSCNTRFAPREHSKSLRVLYSSISTQSVCSSDEGEYDLDIPDQEYTSENTSINSKKLPAIYNMVSFHPGDVILDYGGGKFDNAVNYLSDQDVTLLVYDPYNRSTDHNRDVIRTLKQLGGADASVCSNVLNVIKEPEARMKVLENIQKLTKPGGSVYITVYEGSGKGNEGPTKSGYQLNRKTEGYLDEIQKVFPNARRRGKLVYATNTSNANASSSSILRNYTESNRYNKILSSQICEDEIIGRIIKNNGHEIKYALSHIIEPESLYGGDNYIFYGKTPDGQKVIVYTSPEGEDSISIDGIRAVD